MTLTSLSGIPLIHPGDDLVDLIRTALARTGITLQDGDILVLAQKIVSKAEGRLREPGGGEALGTGQLSWAARSIRMRGWWSWYCRRAGRCCATRPGTMIVEHRLGFVCANAGIDHSNVAGRNRGGSGCCCCRRPGSLGAAYPPGVGGCLRGAPGGDDHQFARARLAAGYSGRGDRSFGHAGVGRPTRHAGSVRFHPCASPGGRRRQAGGCRIAGDGAGGGGHPAVHVRGFPILARGLFRGAAPSPRVQDLVEVKRWKVSSRSWVSRSTSLVEPRGEGGCDLRSGGRQVHRYPALLVACGGYLPGGGSKRRRSWAKSRKGAALLGEDCRLGDFYRREMRFVYFDGDQRP